MNLPARRSLVATLVWLGCGCGLLAQAAVPGEVPAGLSAPAEAPAEAPAAPAGGAPAAPAATVLSAVVTEPPATLTVWNRDIVTFRATLSRPPDERAKGAAERIRSLTDRQLAEPVMSLEAQVAGQVGYLVSVGDTMLFGLVQADVDPVAAESLESVVAGAVENLKVAVEAQRRQRNPKILLRAAWRSAAATVVLAVAVFLVARIRRRLMLRFEHAPGRLDGLRIGDFRLGHYAVALIRWVVWVLKWTARLAVLYVWLTFVLSQYPLTEPWADALGTWLVGTVAYLARAAIGALPGLATATLIFLAARAVSRIVSGFLVGVADGRFEVSWIHPETALATRRIAQLLIWVFAIALAYPFLPGADSAAFQGISVLLGLMLSLGSAGLLNHVMAGWVITYSRSLRPGDYVQIGEIQGTVLEHGALALKILTRRGEEVTIPNAVVTGNVSTNFSRRARGGGMVATTAVTIGYDAPWRQVHAMLELAAEKTEGVLEEPKPRIIQRALSDFYPEYELVVEISPGRQRAEVLTELHGHIQDVFNEHGVQIMSPNFVGQPEEPVLSPKPSWFSAPAKAPQKE